MTKRFVFVVCILTIMQVPIIAQKRYGYAVLYYRCGKEKPEKNRMYVGPVIELNVLNFPRYTDGIDPAIALYSVRYYNYAISKWLEEYLASHKLVIPGDPEKYQRKFRSVIFNEQQAAECNPDKTAMPCFFTDKAALIILRANDIRENRTPEKENNICEVVEL